MRFSRSYGGFDLHVGDYGISWIKPWHSICFGHMVNWNPVRIWLSKYGKIVFYNWKVEEQWGYGSVKRHRNMRKL